MEYWEQHINWWSWDYRAGPDQHQEHRHMPPPFGFALINFVIFAGVMYRLAARPLKDFVRTRHATIKHDIEQAAALHREAEAKLAEYQGKLGALDREIEALLASVRTEAEADKTRIIRAAEEQALRLKAEAERQIENELLRVRRELKGEVVSAAVSAAQSLLAAGVKADDQARLAERFVADMESGRRPS
jgi:F-type H+-transporting ATPase subunit b